MKERRVFRWRRNCKKTRVRLSLKETGRSWWSSVMWYLTQASVNDPASLASQNVFSERSLGLENAIETQFRGNVLAKYIGTISFFLLFLTLTTSRPRKHPVVPKKGRWDKTRPVHRRCPYCCMGWRTERVCGGSDPSQVVGGKILIIDLLPSHWKCGRLCFDRRVFIYLFVCVLLA